MSLAPLNAEQQAVFDFVNHNDEHVFISGKAGVGKSHVIKWLRQSCRKRIAVCAPTGIAALNVSGSTIHNLIGVGTLLPADLHLNINEVKRNRQWLKDLDIILIDEVSMVSSDMMDSIDRVLQKIREDDRPFGGLQMVMVGDPYQLPPVIAKEDAEYYKNNYRSEWFFDAHVWSYEPFKTFELNTVLRQSDAEFKDILNAIRDGTITTDQLHQVNSVGLRNRKRGVDPILLGARKKIVEDHNALKLRSIRAPKHVYTAKVNKGFGHREPADRKLELKLGAKVMMLNNDREERWVNGSMGVVTGATRDTLEVEIDGFTHDVGVHTWVKAGYKPEDYQLAPKFYQMPLKPAWAVTVHKSQGLSLPEIDVDLGAGAFSAGQTYVALSRVTTPGGLYLRNPLRLSDVKVDPNVRRFYEELGT
jgi:ATP-dependent DNA helicase PIF1